MARSKYTKISVEDFLTLVKKHYPNQSELKRTELLDIASKELVAVPEAIWESKVGRGIYNVDTSNVVEFVGPLLPTPTKTPLAEAIALSPRRGVEAVSSAGQNYVPPKDITYVPWGIHAEAVKIIKSGIFFPTYITGLSGNGKTMGLEQACSKTKREFFRVNFTTETDEDDLMGGFRLIDGDTVFSYGPVAEAMMRGAVLVLDEIDLGDPAKIMCLQSVLEGKGYFIKKTNEFITPQEGFQVFATGNTKGKGSDGAFMATNVLNEAFLDRFSSTLEQEYPSQAVERKILSKVIGTLPNSKHDPAKVDEFISNLVKWGSIIRQTFDQGAVDEIISTRRLVHTVKGYAIFGSIKKAIEGATARFDEDTSESFIDLYSKIDAGLEDEIEADATVLNAPSEGFTL